MFISFMMINLLDDEIVVVVAVVGQVETNSLELFFIGNEKSLRGQQLTSIKKNVCIRTKKTNVCLWRRIVVMND